jgi:outer membrane protein TolC
VDSLARVKELVDTRVSDGRELAIESTKAKVASASAQQRVDTLALDLLNAETMLALVLGMSPEDRVKAAAESGRRSRPIFLKGRPSKPRSRTAARSSASNPTSR